MPPMGTSRDTDSSLETATADVIEGAAGRTVKPVARARVGERLTWLFEETTRPDGKRWTILYLCDELRGRGVDVSRQYLGYLMTGERDEPRLSLVEALADVFGVPVAFFTNDYLGRVSSELLPLLSVMHDPATRALVTRPDLPQVAAALADPALTELLVAHSMADVLATLRAPAVQSAIEETMTVWAKYGVRR